MTPEEFVQCFRREKDALLATYLDSASGSVVASRVDTLASSPEQLSEIRGVLDAALTDTFYTILLGLDGCASLGGVQQSYHVRDEHGSEVCTGDGTLEGLAFTYFQEDRDA